MGAHQWNSEPKLCVTIGAEEVARYHFIRRTTFTIGDRTFLAEGVTEEQHMATINEIIGDEEIRCSKRVLEELFNEEKMVIIFRFAMEIEKAKNSLDLNVDVDDGYGDHIVPVLGNGHRVETRVDEQESGIDGFGVVGESVVPTYTYGRGLGVNIPMNWSGVDIGPVYWQNMMATSYALEVDRIYGVAGSEYVGYQPNDISIGDHVTPQPTQPFVAPHVYGRGAPFDIKNVTEVTKGDASTSSMPPVLGVGDFGGASGKKTNEDGGGVEQ
ncbi:hypothetical protein Bca4012_066231 [Brassica carinata]